jgi:prolyl-tRNA synthetase
MRGREFIMKDAYSFDINEEESKKSYKLMYDAYNAIFSRMNLKFRAVDAATGAIGGDMSHEFQVLAETGEDEILSCSKCSYSANIEKAVSGSIVEKKASAGGGTGIKEIYTPNQKTIEEVSNFLVLGDEQFIKTIVFLVDDKPVVALVKGDNEVNEAKIQALLGATSVTPALSFLSSINTSMPKASSMLYIFSAAFITCSLFIWTGITTTSNGAIAAGHIIPFSS